MASVGLRGIASVASIAILTAILEAFLPVNALTAGFLYLIVILIVATKWGLRASVLASASATVCFNYFFLPPLGRLTIADPANWVALFTFLITSLVASQLSERARLRTQQALAEAERRSEHFKSTLLDGLAHEFKTPLTSIRAAASALISDSVRDPEHRRDLLSVIDQESQRLTKLVTEALHLSRIEAGKVQLNRSYRPIRDLIENTLQQAETARDGRKIEVHVSCPELATVMDFELMQLALRQLLDNAMKYSPRDSSIRIRAEVSDAGTRISVHNSGDPIPLNEQHRVFDRFYRSPTLRNTVAGTGMGLSVAREILRAHGGDINLESTPEHGTEFTMVLPLKQRSLAGERENSDRRR